MADKKFLIVYFLWSGNAKKTAARVAEKLDADCFEIVPTEPYSKVYDECLKQVIREVEGNLLPDYQGMCRISMITRILFLVIRHAVRGRRLVTASYSIIL